MHDVIYDQTLRQTRICRDWNSWSGAAMSQNTSHVQPKLRSFEPKIDKGLLHANSKVVLEVAATSLLFNVLVTISLSLNFKSL